MCEGEKLAGEWEAGWRDKVKRSVSNVIATDEEEHGEGTGGKSEIMTALSPTRALLRRNFPTRLVSIM